MYIKCEVSSFEELKENSWSGALQTLERIEHLDKCDEFMNMLEVFFEGDTPTETELNDFIWFEDDTINEYLGI